ncbi:MAG TPA: tetraacyldisaccharide 4'-kinase, partial [Bacteroidota bacterium]|nr:tetraacyldisaccharide 4'-kinase [Bacteroidota bacterium]
MKPNRILLPFSFVYGLGVAIRNAFFEKRVLNHESAGIPVISVGNMTTGGTGKTPIVELIARELSDVRRIRTAIVSRGYMRSSTGLVIVSNGTSI